MAKHRYLSISELCANELFAAQYKVGFDSGKYPYRVISGLPDDAKLVDVKMENHPKMVVFVYHSETFEDIDDIYSQPSLTITVKRSEVYNDKAKNQVTA